MKTTTKLTVRTAKPFELYPSPSYLFPFINMDIITKSFSFWLLMKLPLKVHLLEDQCSELHSVLLFCQTEL
jgi:hypothetical protein